MLIKGNLIILESDTKFSSYCFSIFVYLFHSHPEFSQAIACSGLTHKKLERYLVYLCSQAECLCSYLSLPSHFLIFIHTHMLSDLS